jgi:hypothetical protein
MAYQRKQLPDTNIGDPGPLPEELVGLEDESLADLSWADPALGYRGVGFFPVAEPTPEPQLPREIPPLAFMQRIPPTKRIAIREAAKADPILEDFLDLLGKATIVRLDHADTAAGVGYLVMRGKLTQTEAEALLS